MKKIILVTGGQRSGKSVYAERTALALSPTPVYMATVAGRVVVVDCVTLWCTNFFFNREGEAQPTVDEALDGIKREFDKLTEQDATFIFVTNEIGSGEVSGNAVQRRFTDMQGWMNQYVASRADEVVMMVCGIPVKIK